jgi:hypothetical protein
VNAKRVAAAAGVIHGSQVKGRQTAAGLAADLEAACMLQSPETAAELERLRARVAELEAQRTADHKTWQHDLQTARSGQEASAARIAGLEQRLATSRTEAVADVGDWLDEVGQGDASYLVRTVDIPAGRDMKAVPSRALGEVLDGEHYGLVHHAYRVGHDLPETGGQR